MKLAYAREGGLFPQVAQTAIETDELPTDLQTVVAGILANPDSYAAGSNPNLRDGYQHRLDLRKGRKKISLVFDDLSLPDDVQPLIQFLQQRTRKP